MKIKFRLCIPTWRGNRKIAYSSEQQQYPFFLGLDGKAYYQSRFGLVPVHDAVIHRCSPFKDRLSKEIYEGDLVSFQATPEEVALQGIHVHVYEVFFNEESGSFYLKNIDNKQTEYAGDWLSTTNSDCEIIGNVFNE